jgi:hypothetical protein
MMPYRNWRLWTITRASAEHASDDFAKCSPTEGTRAIFKFTGLRQAPIAALAECYTDLSSAERWLTTLLVDKLPRSSCTLKAANGPFLKCTR